MKRYLEKFSLSMTPVAAYGLILLLSIMGVLGLERYNNAYVNLESELKIRQSELATLQGIKNTDIWPARLAQSLELKESAEEKIWSGRTSGVIAAELQQVIRSLSLNHEVENIVLNVDSSPSRVREIDILRFDFTGSIASGKDTIGLFEALSSSKRSIIISELSATNSIRDKRPTYVTLSGLIPISLSPQIAEGE